MRITAISNNWTHRRGFIAEHGLALLVNWNKKRVLFDTGQGLALPSNLPLLKRSIREIDFVVLSHGHYDHGGALEWLATELEGKTPPLYTHPDALLHRYSRKNGSLQQVGLPEGKNLLAEWMNTELSSEPVELLPGLWLSGEIHPRHAEEAMETEFLIQRGKGIQPDSFMDDQALFAESPKGLVILTGCAHAGLIATIEWALSLLSHTKIHAVIGGFHLDSASEQRIQWTINQLKKWDIPILAPMHCTGLEAIRQLKNAFSQSVRLMGAGDHLDIETK